MTYRSSDLLRGPAIPDVVLQALPKTDLHASLAGSQRPGTLQALAAEAGIPADVTMGCALATLQTDVALQRVAEELVVDAAAAGVRILEVRVSPLDHAEAGLTPDGVLGAVTSGLAAAAVDVACGVVVTGRRQDEPAKNQGLARLAVAWRRRGVVAFGLTGPEQDRATADHREAFYHAKNNNLPSTCDAGLDGGPQSVHEAIHRCGAVRVGHAVRLEEDPDLLDFVNDHRIPLEICLSSSLTAGVVTDLADHPLRRYHEAGLRLCLNTDMALLAATDMVRELRLAADTFDLTLLELEDLLLAGFKSAFLPERRARDLIEGALADFRRIRDEHGLDRLVARGGR